MDGLTDSIWPDDDRTASQIPPQFYTLQRLNTVKLVVFQGFLMVAFMVLAVVFKITHVIFRDKCDDLLILLFSLVAMWASGFIVHHHFLKQHNSLRSRGHHIFYKRLTKISSYQFYLLSFWTALTLLYLAVSLNYFAGVICDWDCPYSALNLTIYCVIVHGLIFLSLIFIYANMVLTFNRMNPVSDIDAIESWRQEVSRTSKVRTGHDNEELERLLERQSNLLEFYECMNQKLIRWVASRNHTV